jgi:hypothetical protein
LLEGLRRIGYEHAFQPIWPIEARHEGTIPWHTMGVYQLGNDVEFHRDIYRHAIQTPGLVVIHDLALDDFVRGMIAAGDPLGHQAMRECLANAHRLESFPEAMTNEPLRAPFASRAAARRAGDRRALAVRRALPARVRRRTPVYVAPTRWSSATRTSAARWPRARRSCPARCSAAARPS